MHAPRCTALEAWGAQRLVIKGDFVDSNTDESWELARWFVDSAHIPWHALPGNHDLAHGHDRPFDRAAAAGIDLVRDVSVVDVPGLRLILMNSAIDGVDVGRWAHLQDDVCAAAASSPGPAMTLVHHQPQAAPIPLHFPPGVSSLVAGKFARALVEANPAVIGSSGHTHRYRRRDLGALPWSEIGSPKDYPGAWAGYVVHEGGIRQVVRRVTAPDCLPWLDRTRHAALGLWGFWSPGRLQDRCFTHAWPAR